MKQYSFNEDMIIEYDKKDNLRYNLHMMYILTQDTEEPDSAGNFKYTLWSIDEVTDEERELANFSDKTDCFSVPYNDLKNLPLLKDFFSNVANDFEQLIEDAEENEADVPLDDEYDWGDDYGDGYDYDSDLWGDDWYKLPKQKPRSSYQWRDSSPRSYVPSTYIPYKPAVTKINVEDYCKSDTLVFHLTDNSTTMLSQVYKGRDWDVINQRDVDPEQIKELFEKHDRIVCLGHGSSYGLFGGNIGPSQAPLFKDKKIFAIWCNADKYFTQHNIGHGMMITKNVPSEVGEAAAIGAHVTADWMLENITYWSKCMADVVDLSWTDPDKAVEVAKGNYQKSKTEESTPDEIKVIDYNTDAIQVLP